MALICAAIMALASQAEPPVRTVDSVDLDRYLGVWYEIARYPNSFQEDCAGDVQAIYAERSDGRLDVTNRCRRADGGIEEADGVARVVDRETSAKLEVRFAPAWLSFLPFVWGDYWILGLADDYSWAVVGTPDREYLWILARTPALEPATYEAALDVVRANGFDPNRLVRTSQEAAPPGTGGEAR